MEEIMSSSVSSVSTRIPDVVVCSVTLEPFRDPVVTPCGHTFERTTIEEYIQRAEAEGKACLCPMDRTRVIAKRDLIPNYVVHSFQARAKFLENLAFGIDQQNELLKEQNDLIRKRIQAQITVEQKLNCFTRLFQACCCREDGVERISSALQEIPVQPQRLQPVFGNELAPKRGPEILLPPLPVTPPDRPVAARAEPVAGLTPPVVESGCAAAAM